MAPSAEGSFCGGGGGRAARAKSRLGRRPTSGALGTALRCSWWLRSMQAPVQKQRHAQSWFVTAGMGQDDEMIVSWLLGTRLNSSPRPHIAGQVHHRDRCSGSTSVLSQHPMKWSVFTHFPAQTSQTREARRIRRMATPFH